MLLQITQHTDSLDSLTQKTGQDQTGLFLLIAGGVIMAIIIIWLLVRQGTKKTLKPTSIQSTRKTNEPIETVNKPKPDSKTNPKPEKQKRQEEAQRKNEPTTIQAEKPKTEKDKIEKTTPEPVKPKPVEPLPEEQSQPKYIGYNPINIFEQTEPYNFPYVIMPKPGSIIKFPRKGRSGRKGFKEENFKSYLTKYFSNAFKIYDDRFITVKGHSKPYEPDITFTDEKNGVNIFLDIEIDEPYEGINEIALRKATHFQYADTNRNNAFKKRGWIVIRFAEIQVHQEPLQCCLFVADVIKSIHSEFKIPSAFQKVDKVTTIKQWTKEEAEQWSKERYREKYLNLPKGFGYVPETEKLEGVQETDLGELIENEVEDEPPFFPPIEKSTISGNPKREMVQAAIQNSKFLALTYNSTRTVVKPLKFKDQDTFVADCYLKNKQREFSLYETSDLVIKQKPFTLEGTGPNLGEGTIKNIVNQSIEYGKLIRMKYTRAPWNEMNIDIETGEIIVTNQIDQETTIRTISNVNFAVNTLAEEHIEQYNLRNENHEYISAYCHLREEERVFRPDRISSIAILDI